MSTDGAPLDEDFFDRHPLSLPMWVVEPISLRDHFTEPQIERLCNSATFEEALTRAMVGLGQHVRMLLPHAEDQRWRVPGFAVSTSCPGDRFMTAFFATPAWDGASASEVARHERETALTDVLMTFEPMMQMPATYLADPLPGVLSQREWFALALGLWWDLRLIEGHTRESAQTMLALTVHPTVQSRIIFTPAGPTLDYA